MPRNPSARLEDEDDDEVLIAQLTAELQAMEDVLSVDLSPVTAFQLVSLLQLARRHQGVSSDLRAIAREFIDGVRDYFADCPTVLDVLARGDDPDEDR